MSFCDFLQTLGAILPNQRSLGASFAQLFKDLAILGGALAPPVPPSPTPLG